MVLLADGLSGAMRWLNERVPYRFTAIFSFEGDVLHNICLIDKQNPSVPKLSDQPISQSYCMYIQASGRDFTVEDSMRDGRVESHAKRRNVQCYYGIPLFDPTGKMVGTVCHFDSMPIRVTEEIATVLDDLAPLIAEAAFKLDHRTSDAA